MRHVEPQAPSKASDLHSILCCCSIFLKKKAAYEAEKENLREKKKRLKAVDKGKSKMRRRTPTQSSLARFIEAAAEWKEKRVNQVADTSSSV